MGGASASKIEEVTKFKVLSRVREGAEVNEGIFDSLDVAQAQLLETPIPLQFAHVQTPKDWLNEAVFKFVHRKTGTGHVSYGYQGGWRDFCLDDEERRKVVIRGAIAESQVIMYKKVGRNRFDVEFAIWATEVEQARKKMMSAKYVEMDKYALLETGYIAALK